MSRSLEPGGAKSSAPEYEWRVVGRTIQGEAHRDLGLANEDAIRYRQDDRETTATTLAVADGHGSKVCFRSATGARFAVDIAVEVLLRFCLDAGATIPAFRREDGLDLARLISESWNRRVLEDLDIHPVTPDELSRAGLDPTADVSDNPLLPYGATLVGVALAASFALYLQIGDGDILAVDDEGRTTRVFERDERRALNETESLCQANAWSEFKCRLVSFEEAVPSILVVTTDGYVNSFATDEDFLLVGRDIHAMLAANGLDWVREHLPSILAETSAAGSRDDTTVGIISRVDSSGTRAARVEPARMLGSGPRRPETASSVRPVDGRVVLTAIVLCVAAAVYALLSLRPAAQTRPTRHHPISGMPLLQTPKPAAPRFGRKPLPKGSISPIRIPVLPQFDKTGAPSAAPHP